MCVGGGAAFSYLLPLAAVVNFNTSIVSFSGVILNFTS